MMDATSNVTPVTENKTYENAYYLNSIAKKYPVEINYGDLHNCSLEEFLAMRETLDYFNELVQANNLSQAEILMYAYDIMKTFRYKENEEDKDNYATKKTGLWLKGLPALTYNCDLPNPMDNAPTWGNGKKKNWTESSHGQTYRSKTFPGIAKAMAEQWG